MPYKPRSQPLPIESILTPLLNEISTIPNEFILVLDDYHLIDAKPVDNALTFLLEHLPPQMHLVITTRDDPNLPLARFRVRNQLTELRAADLRFTPSEATEFLNQVMSLSLSVEDITALEARTEGWIAGLQLAALSLQSHQDVHGFIQATTVSSGAGFDTCQKEPVDIQILLRLLPRAQTTSSQRSQVLISRSISSFFHGSIGTRGPGMPFMGLFRLHFRLAHAKCACS